jgi:hypothetical protein
MHIQDCTIQPGCHLQWKYNNVYWFSQWNKDKTGKKHMCTCILTFKLKINQYTSLEWSVGSILSRYLSNLG